MNDIIEEINRLIDIKIKYLATYTGEVKKIDSGFIEVSIPDLGWDEAGNYAKCKPDFGIGSAITPEIGDYVFVKFISGDKDRPVYTGINTEVSVNPEYDKNTRIIFEDRSTGDYIRYDKQSKKLEIKIDTCEVVLNSDTKGQFSVNKNFTVDV